MVDSEMRFLTAGDIGNDTCAPHNLMIEHDINTKPCKIVYFPVNALSSENSNIEEHKHGFRFCQVPVSQHHPTTFRGAVGVKRARIS